MNWQPIETAPKETALLLATEFFGAGDWRIKCGSFYGGEWHVWGASWTPSHWMPLPAAPGAPAVDESFEDRISDWAHGDALDAERYRWLRDEGRVNDFRVEQEKNGWMKTHSRSTLDAAIDAARAAKESP